MASACLELPSGTAARNFVQGKPGSTIAVVETMLGRAALVGTGLLVAGFRGKDLLKGTVAATVAIEIFVLGYTAYNLRSGSLGGPANPTVPA